MKRRSFFAKLTAWTATAAGASFAGRWYWQTAASAAAQSAAGSIPRRRYNDDVSLSIVGLGGIVLMNQEQSDANREVARAIERGVNYFDVAPSYGKGEAERKLGPALAPFRDAAFLAEKTARRDAAGAREELEQSLRMLQTDRFDLYQLHNLSTSEDLERVFAPGGALETLVAAREEGKVRHLGFSSHNEDTALRLLDLFDWDSVLFPVNYVCYAEGSFGPRLVARAREKGVACLALKALAHTPWENKEARNAISPKCWYRPLADLEKVRAALRFTLSESVVSAIPPGDERVYRIAEDLAADLAPMDAEERRTLLTSAAGLKPIFSQ